MMRKLDPSSFAQLLATARNNGGLPRMLTLMLCVLDQNGYGRGAEIVRDYLVFERPFDPPSIPSALCENCGDDLKAAERANLETGGSIP